jgi:TolB-like protein
LMNTASSAHYEMKPDQKGGFSYGLLVSRLLILFLSIMLSMQSFAAAQSKDKVAVLPFVLHTAKPADHLSLGLQEMLSTRLAEKGFELLDPHAINEGGLARIKASEVDLLRRIAGEMGIIWVIGGSLTQIGDMISLDLAIISVCSDREPLSVFVEGDTMDELSRVLGRAAEMVSNRIKGIDQIEKLSVEGNKRIEEETRT